MVVSIHSFVSVWGDTFVFISSLVAPDLLPSHANTKATQSVSTNLPRTNRRRGENREKETEATTMTRRRIPSHHRSRGAKTFGTFARRRYDRSSSEKRKEKNINATATSDAGQRVGKNNPNPNLILRPRSPHVSRHAGLTPRRRSRTWRAPRSSRKLIDRRRRPLRSFPVPVREVIAQSDRSIGGGRTIGDRRDRGL